MQCIRSLRSIPLTPALHADKLQTVSSLGNSRCVPVRSNSSCSRSTGPVRLVHKHPRPVLSGTLRHFDFSKHSSQILSMYSFLHTSHSLPNAVSPDSSEPGSSSEAASPEPIRVTYILRDGSSRTIAGNHGDNVMYLAHSHGIEIEGACEASLACCTCHVYVEEEHWEELGEITEEEEDMLDMAPELRENSRLSCQILLKSELDGITVEIPRITRNFYVDGHVPQPH